MCVYSFHICYEKFPCEAFLLSFHTIPVVLFFLYDNFFLAFSLLFLDFFYIPSFSIPYSFPPFSYPFLPQFFPSLPPRSFTLFIIFFSSLFINSHVLPPPFSSLAHFSSEQKLKNTSTFSSLASYTNFSDPYSDGGFFPHILFSIYNSRPKINNLFSGKNLNYFVFFSFSLHNLIFYY